MVDPEKGEIPEITVATPETTYIDVVHHVGPMWSVEGHPVTVPPGAEAPELILSRMAAAPSPEITRYIRVNDQGTVFELALSPDGSVSLVGSHDGQHLKMLKDTQAAWIFPAGTFLKPGDQKRVFVGVHPGAGTTTWANLLDGTDTGLQMPPGGPVTAVVRATPAGLHKAKLMVREYSAARFQVFLVVADAPGHLLPAAKREIKVLSSAVPVVEVPWVTKLRGAEDPSIVAASIRKVVSKISNRLETAQVRVPRGFADQVKRKKK